jgi:hypothetical protein
MRSSSCVRQLRRPRGTDRLIAEAPEIYYVKEHYLNYESVLLRLSRVSPDALRDLLGMAYKFVSGKAKKRTQAKKPASRRAKS